MNDPRAKPTFFVPLVGLPMLLLLGGGGLTLGLLESRTASDVKQLPSVEALGDRRLVPHGSYVEVEGTLANRGKLTVVLEGAEDIAIRFEQPSPRPELTVPARFLGRVCDADRRSACGFTHPQNESFPQRRVFAIGMKPDHSRAFILKTYAVAAVTLLVYVGLVAFSRRRRKGGARVVEEGSWTLPITAEDVPARLRALEGADRFQVVEQTSGRLVFIQGYSENAGRGWGIRAAAVFPRRATIRWASSPRDPTQVSARIEEDLVWWPAALTPSMSALARESIASTRMQIERALGVS